MRDRRTAIWSVPEDWASLYLFLFSLQLVALIGLVVWYKIAQVPGDTWPESILSITRGVGASVIAIAGESLVRTEAIALISERYLKKRYNAGIEKGREEGQETTQREWEAWNRRREAAAGEEFTEPPPSLKK